MFSEKLIDVPPGVDDWDDLGELFFQEYLHFKLQVQKKFKMIEYF